MMDRIHEYLVLGINHHMMYPGVDRDEKYHVETLKQVAHIECFDILDMFLPQDKNLREEEIRIIRDSGKEVIYNSPLYYINSEFFDPGSHDRDIFQRSIEEVSKHLYYSAQAGAGKMVFASAHIREDKSYDDQLNRFVDYTCALCQRAAEYGICMIVEPFDTQIDKKFFIGTSETTVKAVERVKECGFDNIGILQDMAHIPLIGESFKEALYTSKEHIHHIHLGNCVMRDKMNPFYGDMHPPLGINGGENDMTELEEFLSILMDIGYIKKGLKNTVSIEARPYPGTSSVTSARVAYEKVCSAFESILVNQWKTEKERLKYV